MPSLPLLAARNTKFILFGLGPEETSWRGVWMLAAVFFGSLAIAAILTPGVYWLVEQWHARTGSQFALWALDKGPARVFDRLRLAAIIAGLPWLLRACWSVPPLRLPLHLAALRAWTLAFVIGLGLIAVLAAAQLAFAPVSPRAGGRWLENALEHLTTSFIVGLVEETIFRGLILRIFYTATGRPWLALVLTSAFFSYAHFGATGTVLAHPGQNVSWLSGWAAAYWTLAGIAVSFDLAKFISLFLLGMVLGALRLRSATLWPAIGLHSGMVMGVRVYNDRYVVEAQAAGGLWGDAWLVNGWAAVAALALTLLCLLVWKHKAGP